MSLEADFVVVTDISQEGKMSRFDDEKFVPIKYSFPVAWTFVSMLLAEIAP
jgi:hypothetical protein